ncbi:MAG: spermidine synthase [Actinobacteria bacterium]|nr:MAG: spermidine synthase [Actinomycetota bacterium]
MRRVSALALGLVVFVATAAVLVLEILAGRILAPYVGVTLRSFTGIIGTVLAAIALGSWAGGRLADRRDPRAILGPTLAVGGLLAILTPAFVDVVAPGWSGEQPLQIVGLAFIGFFAPAAVLSMVTPIAAKIALRTLETTGTVVGSLSAVATAGALFGTFATGFVLLASLPSEPITWLVGGVLLTMAAVFSLPQTRGALLGLTGLAAAAIAFSAAVPHPCLVETPYFCADVHVDPARPSGRELILDTLRHSYVDVEDPTYLGSRYARVMAGVVAAATGGRGPEGALFVGGGGFTIPRYLLAMYGTESVVLELDPRLVEFAEDELDLERGDWLEVHTGDARLTLRRTPPAAFDVVVGDAFGGRSVPWHLTTVEFLTEVRQRLRPGGLYVMNLIDYPPARFVRAELASLATVFPHVAVIPPPRSEAGESGGNFVLVGSLQPLPAGIAFEDGEVVLEGGDAIGFAAGADPLRDSFAPVDQLLGRP